MVRNVRAEDVTDNKPMLCIEDDSPNVTADIWTGRGIAIPFSAKYLPWFFQRGDSTRARQPTRVAPTNRLRHRGWALHVADLCRSSGIFRSDQKCDHAAARDCLCLRPRPGFSRP